MNIETEYIKSLLAKYYAGDSTLNEERIIREYFSESAVDPELETDRAVSAAMTGPVEAPEKLRADIEKAIDGRAVKEVKRRLRPRYSRIAAAAAVLVLAIAASVHFLDSKPAQPEMTPEEAREHTLMALTLLTKTVRKGYSAMDAGAQTASEAITTAENSLNKL